MRLTASYRDKLPTIGISLKNYKKFKNDLKEIVIYDLLGNKYKAYEFKGFYKKIKICFYKTHEAKMRIALIKGSHIIIDDLFYITPLCDGMSVAMQAIGKNIYVIALDKTGGKVFTIGKRKDFRMEMRKKHKK